MPEATHTVVTGERKSTSSRDRIVARSLELFSARGYNGVSMSDIAQASGVTKAALYYHFTDKEALFLEVIRTRTERLAGELERILAGPDDLETTLRRIARFLVEDGLGGYRQLQSDLLTNIAVGRRREHMRATRAVINGIVPRIRAEQEAGVIAADVDLEAAVPLFFSMIGGQIRRFALDPDDRLTTQTNEELADLIVRIWLHGTTTTPAVSAGE